MTNDDLEKLNGVARAALKKDKRRSRANWNGCCINEDRQCEAPELCWPSNTCFRQGTDAPLLASEKAAALGKFTSTFSPSTVLALIAEIERLRTLAAAPAHPPLWLPIESAPKEGLVDIWIQHSDGSGVRWADCYYDKICDQWRTSRPSGHLIYVAARSVTHWMPLPLPPNTGEG